MKAAQSTLSRLLLTTDNYCKRTFGRNSPPQPYKFLKSHFSITSLVRYFRLNIFYISGISSFELDILSSEIYDSRILF